ncbi:MAG: TerC family protein [bacterium]|nr:TerC family protein [bacterium]
MSNPLTLLTIASTVQSATAASENIAAPWWMWVIFHVVIFALLAIDLGFGQRKAHAPTFKESLGWVGFYVGCAALYAGWIFYQYGAQPAILFTTGYVVEYSLSVDNLFVFIALFRFFSVPETVRHRVLFWGILGALVFRGIFIAVGALLISQFQWILYIFGAFLVYTGWKLLRSHDDADVDPANNPILKWCKKQFPVTIDYHGAKFAIRDHGKFLLTPLALVLITVETTDIIFAVDSIPAIFSITSDPFLVYTSNVFAILGLRSLFFVLDRLLPLFRYLKPALALVLAFIGVKMLIHHWVNITPGVSLSIVVTTLFTAVLISIAADKIEKRKRL